MDYWSFFFSLGLTVQILTAFKPYTSKQKGRTPRTVGALDVAA